MSHLIKCTAQTPLSIFIKIQFSSKTFESSSGHNFSNKTASKWLTFQVMKSISPANHESEGRPPPLKVDSRFGVEVESETHEVRRALVEATPDFDRFHGIRP